jgi:hypothetical protein
MCWKQEWAMAINNLQHAQVHIARAQRKLQLRLHRNLQNLMRLQVDKKHNYPSEIDPVKALITRNDLGIAACDQLLDTLQAKQDELYHLIKVHGINHSENPQRVRQLMGKYVPKEASP